MIEPENLHGVKILIVDDSTSWRMALRRALTKIGHLNISESADGTQGLARLRREADFNLIISDWNMEPMDGLEFLKAVRHDPALRTLPFILTTAEAGGGIRNWAHEAGVSYFMPKPFDVEDLRAAINAALAAA
jgi:two-component system chemotaxis response regulator CheY